MSESPLGVGVLSLHSSKETKAILNAVEAMGHRPEWLRRENTTVEVADGGLTIEPDVDVVLNRLLLSNTSQPCEHVGLARTVANAVPTLNDPAATLTAIHKFATATQLVDAGVRVPDAFLALDDGRLNEGLGRFGEEAVYKTAIGTHGGGTWKIGAGDHINARVGDRVAFLQSLIGGDGGPDRDLRVYVVGAEIVGAMYRYAPENDWRTNVALGGSVEPATDLPDEAAEFAVTATQAIGLDYAGVDLVEGEEGWYVLEVNPTAGFKGLFRATGRSPAPILAAKAIEHAGGIVDPGTVDRLAETLDDSQPACTPKPVGGPAGEPKTVGYTEEVLVSGTSDTQRVVAKSDTGASRTSIDTQLAATIGAGPIKDMTRVKSGSMKSGKTRPVVDIVVGVGGDRHTVAASLEDRSHMEYSLLLGRDILGNYRVDVGRRVEDRDGDSEE
ncbi:MAG: RimK/LysX family protein [Halobacteriaceae archaeon]